MKPYFLLVLTISTLLFFISCENPKIKETVIETTIAKPVVIEEDSSKKEPSFRLDRQELRRYGITTTEMARTLQELLYTKGLSIDSILNSTFIVENRKGDKLEVPMNEFLEIEE